MKCILTIGHEDYLLPSEQLALSVLSAMGKAVRVDRNYNAKGDEYRVGKAPSLQIKAVTAETVLKGETAAPCKDAPQPTKRRNVRPH